MTNWITVKTYQNSHTNIQDNLQVMNVTSWKILLRTSIYINLFLQDILWMPRFSTQIWHSLKQTFLFLLYIFYSQKLKFMILLINKIKNAIWIASLCQFKDASTEFPKIFRDLIFITILIFFCRKKVLNTILWNGIVKKFALYSRLINLSV